MFKPAASLLCDFYKQGHADQYPVKTELVYSTWTPRATRMAGVNEVVVAGHQPFIKEWLIDFFNENFFSRPKSEVIEEYTRIIKNTLGIANPNSSRIEALYDLGYLPLEIKALPEGTVVPLRTPTLTIQNTKKEFYWLTNFIESLASCEIWPVYTSATTAHEFRKMLDRAALETVGDTSFVQFQGHDFSLRGMMGLHAATLTGMGHLMSFVGTDTIPAIQAAEHFYGANVEKDLIGTSISATEHSVQCAYGNDKEYLTKMITDIYPSGFVSIVSDGYDFWSVIGEVIPSLKDKIMSRDGRVVIRPDSGRPDLIICGDPEGKTELERKGAVEALWDIFGGTTTKKGFKLLDSHIGLIYGDAITLLLAEKIVKRLAEKGFASINCVFGIGSFTYQYVTRDTFGFALKSTLCIIDGVEKQIFKNPKTDDGTKKSQKGVVYVYKSVNGEIKWSDGHSLDDRFTDNLLQPIFKDGKLLVNEKFSDIRARLVEARTKKVLATI
jgi:nicotinamide phosphoribosyltransferase